MKSPKFAPGVDALLDELSAVRLEETVTLSSHARGILEKPQRPKDGKLLNYTLGEKYGLQAKLPRIPLDERQPRLGK